MKHSTSKALLGAAVMAAVSALAHASDAEGEFHGYARAGTGHNSGNGAQACFGLQGVAKYRLGNECETYGEAAYTREIAKSGNGASFVGTVMANIYAPGSSGTGDNKIGINQLFVEAKNLDFLKGGTVWVGERFYNRPDIHMIDFKYLHGDGIGAGMDGLPLGPGKFSYALFRNDIDNKSTSATRHNFTYDGLAVNPNGSLKLDAIYISADTSVPGGHNGWALSAIHTQDKVLGGNNKIGLQYGIGPATFIGGTGSILLGSDTTRTRLFDTIYWQVSPEFGGSAVALIQRDKTPTGTQTWTSIGARPVYALTENLKLQLEVGHDRISPAAGGDTQQLTKITFAPTIAAGKGVWSRPELRTFVTYAKWNTAAQNAANLAAPGSALSSTGVFGGSTNGTSIGVQVESWW